MLRSLLPLLALAVLGAANESWQAALQLPDTAAAPAAAPAAPPADRFNADVDLSSAAAVALAKGAMLRAKRQALEAQQAAALARAAYERVARSRSAAAEAAGQAALDAVIKDARMQARQVQDLRQTIEDRARKDANQDAVAAATPYKQAKIRDLAVADAWQKSGEELKAAAEQYRAIPKAPEQTGLSEAARRDVALRAHQALATAELYEERAKTALKRAEEIRQNATWYDEAEVAAARQALQAALPEGMSMPDLPPLP